MIRQAQSLSHCAAGPVSTMLLCQLMLLQLRQLAVAVAMVPTLPVSPTLCIDALLLPSQLQICSVARLSCGVHTSNCVSSSAPLNAGSAAEDTVRREGHAMAATGPQSWNLRLETSNLRETPFQ